MGRPFAGAPASPPRSPAREVSGRSGSDAPADERGSRWEALPDALLLRVLAALPRSGDACCARLACSAWRNAHDGGATALRPACLPATAAPRLLLALPALTSLDLSRCRPEPTCLAPVLASLAHLASLTLPPGFPLAPSSLPEALPAMRRLTAKVEPSPPLTHTHTVLLSSSSHIC